MGTARWSERALREFIRRLETAAWWRLDESDEEREVAALREQLRAHVAPAVQSRVLASIGALVDLHGIAIVAAELVVEGDEHERRWLLVTLDPWGYLADWVTASIVSSYKSAKGTRRVHGKRLEQLEKSLEA